MEVPLKPDDPIVRLPSRKVLSSIGNLLDRRQLVVIHYKDEEDYDILFGFYRVPGTLNLQSEVERYRDQHPKVMTLSRWLIKHGARSVGRLDRKYRQAAQKKSYRLLNEGERPIRINPDEIEAEPFELTW